MQLMCKTFDGVWALCMTKSAKTLCRQHEFHFFATLRVIEDGHQTDRVKKKLAHRSCIYENETESSPNAYSVAQTYIQTRCKGPKKVSQFLAGFCCDIARSHNKPSRSTPPPLPHHPRKWKWGQVLQRPLQSLDGKIEVMLALGVRH